MKELHHGDNLAIMQGIEACSVDLIYADPPFNSGKDWGEYDDRWASDNAYIAFMRERLLEMKRLLKPTGSLYLHCDPTMSHYLKVLMDSVFGRAQFRNEIAWCYSTSGRAKRFFAKKHDTILLFTKSDSAFWGDYRIPVSPEYLSSHYRQVDEHGRRCRIRVDAGKQRTYYPDKGMTCNDWWDIPYLNSQAKERTGYPT